MKFRCNALVQWSHCQLYVCEEWRHVRILILRMRINSKLAFIVVQVAHSTSTTYKFAKWICCQKLIRQHSVIKIVHYYVNIFEIYLFMLLKKFSFATILINVEKCQMGQEVNKIIFITIHTSIYHFILIVSRCIIAYWS